MTRQTPDWLTCETGHYSLYPCLPLLPEGDPRREKCRFGFGYSTANYRGYHARWTVRDGRLFLDACGGNAPDDASGRRVPAEGPRAQIGMIDIHEVDTPVPATWVSCDLVCPSTRSRRTSLEADIPHHFRLFRVVRGAVLEDLKIANASRVWDMDFQREALLEEHARWTAPGRVADPPAVPGLARALRASGGANADRRLAGLLWQAGRADLDVLISGLASVGDPDVRRWIACALARIGPDAAPAIEGLMRALPASDEPEVARAIVYALAGIGLPAASTFARVIPLAEARCGLRADSQIQLFVERLAVAGEGTINVLIAGLLATRSAGVRYRIAAALGDLVAVAVPTLRDAFAACADDRERAALAQALGRIGRDAGPALGPLLDRLEALEDDKAREVFAEAIAAIGLRSPASLPPLRAAFRSARDARTRKWLADAMASLGGGAVAPLLQEFEVAGTAARTAITEVLGAFGPDAMTAAWPLAAAAESSGDRDFVRQVAEALRKIGAPANLLVPIQIAAIGHAPYGSWAEGVLREMAGGLAPSKDAARDLSALLVRIGECTSGRLVAAVLGTLGEVAVEPLLRALGEVRDERRRLLVIHALGLIGLPAAAALDDVVAALAAASSDPARLQLVDDLRRIGRPGEQHLAVLAGVLDRTSFLPVWWRLGLVLAEFGVPAIATLVALLGRTRDDDQRRAIGNALGRIGATAAAAAPALQAAMQAARDPQARETLAVALRKTALRLV